MRTYLNTLFAAALVVAAASSTTAAAQQVRLAAGVRAGAPYGVSAKAFVTRDIAVELNATRWDNGDFGQTSISGGLFFYLDDHGFASPLLRKIKFYGGASAGRTYYKYSQAFLDARVPQSGQGEKGGLIEGNVVDYAPFSVNLRGYLGAQYLLPNAPIEITVDLGPSISTGAIPNPIGGHASVGVRYVLLRQGGKLSH